MDKLTLLILVVIVGFAVCWRSLWRIEAYLYRCAAQLSSLDSTTDDIKSSAEQAATTLDNIWGHFESRFPAFEEHDDPDSPI